MKRIKIVYRERHYIDKFSCIDYTRTLYAYSIFQSGELIYCKVNQFGYKTIDTNFIDSIEGV